VNSVISSRIRPAANHAPEKRICNAGHRRQYRRRRIVKSRILKDEGIMLSMDANSV